MSTSEKLSVVVVNYNSTGYLNRLIQSLVKIGDIVEEIIIVDNNSIDFKNTYTDPKIRTIINPSNVGFSTAVNQGIAHSKCNYILLLNPDCVLVDNSIFIIYEQIKNDKSTASIGGKIQSEDTSKPQYTANTAPTFLTGIFEFTNMKKLFPKNKYSKKFWTESKDTINHCVEVDALCGAFILFRKKIGVTSLCFDQDYFLYLEDLQFGLDIRRMGYKVMFNPQAKVKHVGGSSNNSKYNIVLSEWYKSRRIFFRKNLNALESIILIFIFSIEEQLLRIVHYLKNEPNT